MGKNYDIPLPGPAPEIREKLQKDYQSCIFGAIVQLVFGAQFSPFSGVRPGRGILQFFPHFSGISAPVAFRASFDALKAVRRVTHGVWYSVTLYTLGTTFALLWALASDDFLTVSSYLCRNPWPTGIGLPSESTRCS